MKKRTGRVISMTQYDECMRAAQAVADSIPKAHRCKRAHAFADEAKKHLYACSIEQEVDPEQYHILYMDRINLGNSRYPDWTFEFYFINPRDLRNRTNVFFVTTD